ncbi:hypothetical protein NTGBS_130035 [Candidatus Nitrotoga sp. BS]|nr:hypothetical protein NTGBS_130035 [Candidatus Nitrotoga sp. BS]
MKSGQKILKMHDVEMVIIES